MLNLATSLETLSDQRPIFHSEADFQHAFAWEVQKQNPASSVRLERPFIIAGKQAHVDVWVSSPSAKIAIELKYKTRKLETEVLRESFRLKDQSAQDLGRYDFLVDIQRVEELIRLGEADCGYAIILSNDSSYWRPPRDPRTVDAAFRIHTGATVAGVLEWGFHASPGTTKGREEAISLDGEYSLKWSNYSKLSSASYGVFRFLLVGIGLN